MIGSEGKQTNEVEGNLFFDVIRAGDLGRVRQMLQDNSDLLLIEDERQWSPVLRATHSPFPEVADYLSQVLLQRIRNGTIPQDRLYAALHDLGEALHSGTGFRGCEILRAEAAPVVAGFLKHRISRFRYIAVSVLSAHWDLVRYATTFQRMALRDPDDSVRKIALSSVGYLLRDTRDRNATKLLLHIFRDFGESAPTRQIAYEGLVEVWQGFHAWHQLIMTIMEREQRLGRESDKSWEGVWLIGTLYGRSKENWRIGHS
jgi:hypothetical protein